MIEMILFFCVIIVVATAWIRHNKAKRYMKEHGITEEGVQVQQSEPQTPKPENTNEVKVTKDFGYYYTNEQFPAIQWDGKESTLIALRERMKGKATLVMRDSGELHLRNNSNNLRTVKKGTWIVQSFDGGFEFLPDELFKFFFGKV